MLLHVHAHVLEQGLTTWPKLEADVSEHKKRSTMCLRFLHLSDGEGVKSCSITVATEEG